MSADRTASQSPIRHSLSSIGTRLSKVLTNTSDTAVGSTNGVEGVDKDRSNSRGRTQYTSSGRGGAGNINRSLSSTNPNKSSVVAEDDGSSPRGREMAVSPKAMSSGRGGAGNIRLPNETSPSPNLKDRSLSPQERKILANHMAQQESLGIRSSGRGGAGNIHFPPTPTPASSQAPAPTSPPAYSLEPQSQQQTERGRGNTPTTTIGTIWDKVRSSTSGSRGRNGLPARDPLVTVPETARVKV